MNKETLILLPTAICFIISLIHILFYKLSRKKRCWISILGGLVVLLSTIYIVCNCTWFLLLGGISSFFAILISFLGLLVIIYSQKYNWQSTFVYDCLLFFFIGSMLGTTLSPNLILFYSFWEFMTFSSFFLILYENTKEAKSASIKYLIMTGAGSIFLLFGILGYLSGIAGQSIFWKHLLFFSIIIGAGIKAGLFPLHSWLADAHPAAPTPISALLSGIMIKIGIYALILFYFEIFSPSWSIGWQTIMIIIGCLTVLTGCLLAIIQNDIKRLLAFSSIGQIGYIFLGIACGTNLGLLGALYHTLNHALFKGLLFLAAGVIIKKVGSRNLSDYGGLGEKMPFTFFAFFIASLSISGIPPFNGFISKWIIYQALLEKGTVLTTVAFLIAILGSCLTLAACLKVLNDTFLGVRKRENIQKESRISPFFSIPMGVLSVLCFILGVFPDFFMNNVFSKIVFAPEVNISLINIVNFYGILLVLVFFVIFIFYKKIIGKMSKKEIFTGGEKLEREIASFDGSQFYLTLRELPVLKTIYNWEDKGYLDIYNIFLKKIVPWLKKVFKVFEISFPTNDKNKT
ncbi:MAG TPA: proton-conducting transporter membrane subunit [bacterium]|nr:proton-conducting transporter membrane subunit [bacterium]